MPRGTIFFVSKSLIFAISSLFCSSIVAILKLTFSCFLSTFASESVEATMAVGNVFTRSSFVLFLLLWFHLQPCFSPKMEKLTDRRLSTGSLVALSGIKVDKAPRLHSATTVRLQRRHVGFTHLSRKGFFASRVKHSNSTSTFQITRIVLNGDVSMNPGPPKCSACDKTIARNNCAVEFSTCHRRLHIKCGKVKPIEFDRIRAQSVKIWTCPCFLDQLKQLPFANESNFDMSGRLTDTSDTENDSMFDSWSSFDLLAKKHGANTKIGHINANNIAGFKFHDIRSWLLSGRFDILLITETKIDASFSNGQFNVDGFRMHRVDRDIHFGGLMIFIRNDICFHVMTRFNMDLSIFRTESMILKGKINRSWFVLAGIYKHPNIPKSQWKLELSSIFDATTTLSNDVIFLGDFNCDMMEPNKPPMDGWDLCDLLDIYNLKNLITSPMTMTNFDFEFTHSKQVEKFLLEMNTRKSCGHDLIPPRLLKESASVISEPLAKIMNCSISLGHYPSRWKMEQATPLFKKGDEFCKNNYRPVSVAVVSMDLSKAFDSIPHALLLAKLKAYGLGETSIVLLRSYLSTRIQRVKIGDTFSEWEM